MPVFTRSGDLRRYLREAALELQKETVVTAQARLGSSRVSPIDTGRLRSSWFAAAGNPSSAVAPEGTNAPSTDATGLQVRVGVIYHLTNNLPYAQSVAIEGRVVSKPKNWFIDFVNVTIPNIQQAAGTTIKRRFDL